jgi:hypothetical protein
MKLDARSVLRFTLLFIIMFVVCLLVYPLVMKVYHPAAMGAANLIMKQMDPPTEIILNDWNGWRALVVEGGYRVKICDWLSWQKHLHFLSLVLLPALIMATPAPWSARFRLLAIAIPILFVVHSLTIVGIVRTQYCVMLDPLAFSCRWSRRVVNTSGQLFGFGLWVVLTWRYWVAKDPKNSEGAAT